MPKMRLADSPDAEVSIRKQDAHKLPQFAGVKLPSALSKAMSLQQSHTTPPPASPSQQTPEQSPEPPRQTPAHPSEFTVLAQRLGKIQLRTPAVTGPQATPLPKVKPSRLDFDAALTPQQDKENVHSNSNTPSMEAEKLALAAGVLSRIGAKGEKPTPPVFKNVMSVKVPALNVAHINHTVAEPSPMVIAQTPAVPRDLFGDALIIISKHKDTPQSWQKLCNALCFVERTLYEKSDSNPAVIQRVAKEVKQITAALGRCIGSYQPQVIHSALRLVNALVLTKTTANTPTINRLFDDIADLATSKSVTAKEAALTMVTFVLAEPDVAPKLRNTMNIERMVQHMQNEFESGKHSTGKMNMIKQAIDVVIANSPSRSLGSPTSVPSFSTTPLPPRTPLIVDQSVHNTNVSPKTPASRQISSASQVKSTTPPSPPTTFATLPRNKRLSSARASRRMVPNEITKALKYTQEDLDEVRRVAVDEAQNEFNSNGKKYEDSDLEKARREGEEKAKQEYLSSGFKFTEADIDAARQTAITEASEKASANMFTADDLKQAVDEAKEKASADMFTADDLKQAVDEAKEKVMLNMKSVGNEYTEDDLQAARKSARDEAIAELESTGNSFTDADLGNARQQGYEEASKLLFKKEDLEKARVEGAEHEKSVAKSSGFLFTKNDLDKARQDAIDEMRSAGTLYSDSDIENIRQEALSAAKSAGDLFSKLDVEKACNEAFSKAKAEASEEAAKSDIKFTQEDIETAKQIAFEEGKNMVDPKKKYTEEDLQKACEKVQIEAKEDSKAETMDIAQGIAEGLAKADVDELKKKLDVERKENEEYHVIFKEYERTMKEMADSNMDNQNHGLLDAEVSRLKNELFEATQAFNKMKDRYTESKEVIAVMEGKEARVVEQNHELRQSLLELQNWCNELKANSEKKLAKAFENVSHYRSTYLDREAHAKKALSELKSANAELEQSRQTCSDLSNKLSGSELQLHTSQDEATGLKAALNEMRVQCQQATAECNNLREDASAAKASLVKVQKELDQLKESESAAAQAVNKAKSLATETRALKASAYDYMSRNRNLEKQLEEKEKECKEIHLICEELIGTLEAEKQKTRS